MSWPHFAPRPRPEEPEYPFRWTTSYLGLLIDIETDAGEERTGVSEDGEPWSHTLRYPYGEVRGTIGADGDAVDVYLGPHRLSPWVYVIQTKFPGERAFDETKSMIGFRTQAEAEAAFRSGYGLPGFHLSTTRWPAAAWAEAMVRPAVAASKMASPLAKGRIDWSREIDNRTIDGWTWLIGEDEPETWSRAKRWGLTKDQTKIVETSSGRQIAVIGGAVNDLDGFVSKHGLVRMDPETRTVLRRLQKATRRDLLPGGEADDKQQRDFDAEALDEGTKHEREHTTDPDIAREIAMDHLSEDGDYYDKLKTIEKARRAGVRFVVDIAELEKALADAAL